jgi:5'-3' exonuclease
MFNVLIMNKLPYEAYVYSKDMDLLKEICKMYFVNFDEFIMRFNPQNMINILNELLYNLS